MNYETTRMIDLERSYLLPPDYPDDDWEEPQEVTVQNAVGLHITPTNPYCDTKPFSVYGEVTYKRFDFGTVYYCGGRSFEEELIVIIYG